MIIYFFAFIALICAVLAGCKFWQRRKQQMLLSSVLGADDWEIVQGMVPLVNRMPTRLQLRLQGKITLFLDQIDIYGRGGVVVDRRTELSIAAQACLLIVNTDAWYSTLRTILLYPSAFTSRQENHDGFVVTEESQARLGESWQHGPVVLSWPHAAQGGLNGLDGQNLVLHEFAHQLDALSGQTNAVPILAHEQRFEDWEKAIMAAYETHVANVSHNKKTVLSDYAATNYVEFLAVSIEVFFEKPARLKGEYPDVYEQLSILLNLNPLEWA